MLTLIFFNCAIFIFFILGFNLNVEGDSLRFTLTSFSLAITLTDPLEDFFTLLKLTHGILNRASSSPFQN